MKVGLLIALAVILALAYYFLVFKKSPATTASGSSTGAINNAILAKLAANKSTSTTPPPPSTTPSAAVTPCSTTTGTVMTCACGNAYSTNATYLASGCTGGTLPRTFVARSDGLTAMCDTPPPEYLYVGPSSKHLYESASDCAKVGSCSKIPYIS